MNKKNISFVIPNLDAGGAQRVVTNLSNELAKNFKVSIITFKKCTPFYKLDEKVTLRYCLPHIKPSKTILDTFILNLKLIIRIFKELKKNEADCAVSFLTSANYLSVIAAKFLGIKCIVNVRINPFQAKTTFKRGLARKLIYPMANAVVVQTDGIKKYFSDWINNEKLVILPNPLSSELVEHKSKSSREKYILSVGRLTHQKGHDVLIKAFCNIEHQDWKLVIVGEGNKREEYNRIIAEYGLTDKIILEGQKENIHDYYNTAGVFVFPSRFEGFPNALIEALYFGIPTISTNCPSGPSELINDGKNGFLIDVDDDLELEAKLGLLLNDHALRETFSTNAENSVNHFNMDNVLKKWETLILKVIHD